MLAPEQATVFVRKPDDLLRNLSDQLFLLRVFHVDGRSNMQDTGIDVAEHAIIQTTTVQSCAEFGDVIGEVFWRNGHIFHERDGPLVALHVAKKTNRSFPHISDAFYGLLLASNRKATPPAPRSFRSKRVGHVPHRGFDNLFAISDKLDDIDSHRQLRVVGEELPDVLPDNILVRERQNLGVDRFDRGGSKPYQGLSIAKRRVEASVADIDERAMPGDRQHAKLRFREQPQRSLCPAQDRVQIEAPMSVSDVSQVVAR